MQDEKGEMRNTKMLKKRAQTTNNQLLTTYKVEGMHCESCAKMIELDLEDEGITATCDYASCELKIVNQNADLNQVKKVIEKSGYKLVTNQ